MATALGTCFFIGDSGQAYIKDVFVVDTANAKNDFDKGGGAASGSGDEWVPPENVTLSKYVQATATGQTRTRLVINGNPTESLLRNSEHIPSATIIGTPYIGLRIKAGQRFSMIAIA